MTRQNAQILVYGGSAVLTSFFLGFVVSKLTTKTNNDDSMTGSLSIRLRSCRGDVDHKIFQLEVQKKKYEDLLKKCYQ